MRGYVDVLGSRDLFSDFEFTTQTLNPQMIIYQNLILYFTLNHDMMGAVQMW